MKSLMDIVNRIPNPSAWTEGDNIPWNDPDFSERMLAEHLSQEHDLASRKSATIDEHVDWIFSTVLDGRPGALLDLGCGTGRGASSWRSGRAATPWAWTGRPRCSRRRAPRMRRDA